MKVVDSGLRRDKLVVIDLNNFIFRAFFAFPSKKNSKGVEIGAIEGFFRLYYKLFNSLKPTNVLICKDVGKMNFRYDLYSEYKANRSETPQDLRDQLKIIWKLIDELEILSWGVKNYEADDLIGTISKKWVAYFDQMLIATTDKDLSQLINPKVKVYNPSKDTIIDENHIYRNFGIKPPQILDFLALLGDAADNIPGVKGVGEKTAIKLLREFKTVENVYKNIDMVEPERIRKKMIDQKEMAFLSKKLVSIPTDIPCELKSKDSKVSEMKITNIFNELEIKSAMISIEKINKIIKGY